MLCRQLGFLCTHRRHSSGPTPPDGRAVMCQAPWRVTGRLGLSHLSATSEEAWPQGGKEEAKGDQREGWKAGAGCHPAGGHGSCCAPGGTSPSRMSPDGVTPWRGKGLVSWLSLFPFPTGQNRVLEGSTPGASGVRHLGHVAPWEASRSTQLEAQQERGPCAGRWL